MYVALVRRVEPTDGVDRPDRLGGTDGRQGTGPPGAPDRFAGMGFGRHLDAGGSEGRSGRSGLPFGDWLAQVLDDSGAPIGAAEEITDPARLTEIDTSGARWLFDAAATIYPTLMDAGVRIARCHDVSLVERILLGREHRHGEPSAAAAVAARAKGRPAPPDPDRSTATGPAGQPTLFDSGVNPIDAAAALDELRIALTSQLARIAASGAATGALRLLVAAESASALVAAEMGRYGLPMSARVHRELLERRLGPQPSPGARPVVLESLAARITAEFGFPVNPDSSVELREAFRRNGFDLESARSWVIRQIEHPAVPALLEYKELARLFSANGWNWLAEWVRDGRFHAEYLPGGVVSGRWAARGGGGLQIPKLVRRAVIADPGWVFVVADAAQLEPRVLAALSSDSALEAVSGPGDLYQGLADDGFGGDRAAAKLAMLGAMYGQTSGEAARLMTTLRRRYPAAVGYVEHAAQRGERGKPVRTVLGRTSPAPSPAWWSAVREGALPDASDATERRGRQIARSWGRFTRNFVVQGSAADWASVWLSLLRTDLAAAAITQPPELVFFQHDELIVHAPEHAADEVSALTVSAADRARRLVFPGATTMLPVRPVVVRCYADAK